MIIVDSSAIISLYFPEKYSEEVVKFLQKESDVHTLDLAFYEVASAIRKKVIRKEISAEDAKNIYEEIKAEFFGSLKIHRVDEVIDDALELALNYNMSVYDASFVQLAIKYNGKLLTTDERLMNVQGLKKYFIELT